MKGVVCDRLVDKLCDYAKAGQETESFITLIVALQHPLRRTQCADNKRPCNYISTIYPHQLSSDTRNSSGALQMSHWRAVPLIILIFY